MKLKQIVADHSHLLAAGMKTLSQAAVLTHIGRRGLQGGTITGISESLRMAESTVFHVVLLLEELKLVTRYSRSNRGGRPLYLTCTVAGWELLTRPPDYSLFPDALKEVVK